MELSNATPISTELRNPQTIFSWKAPLRPYKKRGKNILRFYIALALLLSLIVFFFGDRILLVPIWAMLFLFYSLTVTAPGDVTNKLTKFGIETADVTIRWEVLSHFYFSKRFGYDMVTVVSHGPYYFQSYMVLPDEETKRRVMTILSEHLVYQEKPQKTLTDRMIDWFSKLVPDDDEVIPLSSFHQKQMPASP